MIVAGTGVIPTSVFPLNLQTYFSLAVFHPLWVFSRVDVRCPVR